MPNKPDADMATCMPREPLRASSFLTAPLPFAIGAPSQPNTVSSHGSAALVSPNAARPSSDAFVRDSIEAAPWVNVAVLFRPAAPSLSPPAHVHSSNDLCQTASTIDLSRSVFASAALLRRLRVISGAWCELRCAHTDAAFAVRIHLWGDHLVAQHDNAPTTAVVGYRNNSGSDGTLITKGESDAADRLHVSPAAALALGLDLNCAPVRVVRLALPATRASILSSFASSHSSSSSSSSFSSSSLSSKLAVPSSATALSAAVRAAPLPVAAAVTLARVRSPQSSGDVDYSSSIRMALRNCEALSIGMQLIVHVFENFLCFVVVSLQSTLCS
jgi:hypothetical protein